jgi:hypothetical protein
MTFDELVGKILQVLPNATFDKDNYGQLIIYTDCTTDSNDNVQPLPVDGE